MTGQRNLRQGPEVGDEEEGSFKLTPDGAPDPSADNIYLTVREKSRADDVAACLRNDGAIGVDVLPYTAPKSFTPTGP